jgi:TonB family protein
MARRSQLEGRLVAILDSGINRHPAGRRAAVVTALAAVTLAAPFAAVEAQEAAQSSGVNFRVVSTSDNPPEVNATIRAAESQQNYEILDRAATAYQNLRQFDTARILLQRALAVRGQVGGQTGAVYAVGLVKLGDLEMAAGHPEQADAAYTQAVALGDRPEVARALYNLGNRAHAAHDDAAATDYYERVLKVAPQGQSAAAATLELASIAASQPGREADADALYQKAIAMDQPPYDRAMALDRYARFLERQNRGSEAEQATVRARQIRGATSKAASAEIVFPPGVYRVGNGVTAPVLLYKVEPQYTEEARAAKYQGTVLVFAEIQPDGTATNIKVIRSLGLGLDQKAIEAVSQWRFKPGTKDGVPVPVGATIEVNFRLL